MADPASAPVAAIAANGNVNGMVDWAALAAQWASQRDAGVDPRMHMNGATSNTLPDTLKPAQHMHMAPDSAYRPPAPMGDKYYPLPPPGQPESSFPVPSYGYNAGHSSVAASVAEKPPGEDTSDDLPPGCSGEDTVQSTTATAPSPGMAPPGSQTSLNTSQNSEEAPPGTESVSNTKPESSTASTLSKEPVPPPVTAGPPPAYPPAGQYPPYYHPGPPAGGYPYYPPHGAGPSPYGAPGYGPPPGHHMPPYPPRPYAAPFRGGYNRGPNYYRGPGPNSYGPPPHHSDSASAWLTPQNDVMTSNASSKGPPFYRENEAVPTVTEAEQPSDQKNRKQVPLWIRQEIERLEADKLKKLEKERQRNDANEQKMQHEEEKNVSNNIPTRRYYDVPSPNASHDKHTNRNSRRSRTDSGSPPSRPEFDLRDKLNESHRKRSPSPILTEEEKEAKILKRTKVVLTDILLSVTTEEIESVAKEVYAKFKQKEPAKLRRDFRLDYDRSESESRASGKSESEDETFVETKNSIKKVLSEERPGSSLKINNETGRNNDQSGFSRLSPSIRERFESKIEDERNESNVLKRKESDSKQHKTPERKRRNSSYGDEDRSSRKRNHSRSRDVSKSRTSKKSKKKNSEAHRSDTEDEVKDRSRSRDKCRSRSREKGRSKSYDREKSRSRDRKKSRTAEKMSKGSKQKSNKSNRKSSVERSRKDDVDDSYEQSTPPSSAHKSEQPKKQLKVHSSEKKRKDRSRTPKSRSRSRSYDDDKSKRSKEKNKSDKKKKHKKSSHRHNSRDYGDDRSRSRSKSRSRSLSRERGAKYSEDEVRDSGKKSKKKKK